MARLKTEAKDLGKDDKHIHFFVMPDKIFKVSNNVSKGTAKITLKLSRIGQGSDFEEIEVPIDPADYEKAVRLLKELGVAEWSKPIFTERHNFEYKGVEIAVKYSEDWGYHAELEVVVPRMGDKPAAEEKIRAVAAELGLQLMTEGELRVFTGKFEEIYNPKFRK
jgi:adenylate cyclase class IV